MECSARILSVRWVPLVLWAAFAVPMVAQEEELSFDELRKALDSPRELSAAQWAQAMRLLGQPEARDAIRASILARSDFPRKDLVALLTHERIAVRLGALEILEEVTGGTFGYVPWSQAGKDPRNEAPLKQWREWAEEEGEVSSAGSVLSDNLLQGYLRDILSDDRARGKRAMRMLESHAMGGVKAIQDFLTAQPELPVGHRARLKEAQYYLVLVRSARDNAAILARDLVFGNRDQRLGALAGLKRTGLDGVPIVREYLASSDALVRETAIDSLLSLGGNQVLSLAEPVLAGEKDVNVIHSAIRSLKDIGGQKVIEMIAPFLDHPDEDLVVSAVQTLTSLKGGNSRFSPSGRGPAKAGPIDQKVLELLEDGRWRIRATALEYVEKLRVKDAKDRLTPMLDDPDEFVRYRAVETAVALGVSGAFERLRKMFLTDDDMIGPVAKAYARRNQALDAEMTAHLEKRPPDVIVSAIRAMASDHKTVLDVIAHFAKHENIDVSCAALRLLASDSDDLEHNKYASVVLEGLRSGVPEKRETVLEALRLPREAAAVDPAMWQLIIGNSGEGEPTALDPLYDAFLKVRSAPTPQATEAKAIQGALGELVAELRKIVTEGGDPAQRAAYLLTLIEDPAGAEWYKDRMESLSSAQRAALAESIYTIRSESLLPIMVALLRDPVDKIRREAAESCFDSGNNPALVQAGLKEISDSERPLTAHEAYGWRLETSAEHQHMGRVISKWCREVLADEEASNPVRILATILLRSKMRSSDEKVFLELTQSADQWVRRAAWFSLAEGRPSSFRKNLQALVDDPSPAVREVLMEVTTRMDSSWMHVFSDAHQERNQNSDYYREKRRLSKVEQGALEKMAAEDGSDRVRFEALMVLMSHGKTIDLEALIALIPKQPKEAYVSYRIARYFRTNSRSVGRGLRPLLAFADMDQLDGESLQQVLARMAGSDDGKADFLSFESLVSAAAETAPQHTAVLKDPAKAAVERTALKVVYFFNEGCDHCEKVSRMLDAMKNEFPLLSVDRKDIRSAENLLLNQALSQRFGAEASQAPAIFVQGGALIHPEITPNRLGVLLANTMELPMEAGWNLVEEAALEVAKEQLDSKFDALTMAVVIGAGLLDGVNPCAFATIIFLLSYLQVAKRSPREILMVGGAFILAVFLAYLLVGLALHQFIEHLAKFGWMQTVMTWTFAAFAGLVALLSFRDGLRARKGKLGDMTLQLPGFLKTRIRGVIRTHARARHFVLAAFAAGIIISFLELACTGQVYAPIIFQIQQGNLGAVQWLVIYNVAFITPLVIVFLLAYGGMRSDALITFQKNHTATVKFGMAGFFLILCLLLIFGKALMSF